MLKSAARVGKRWCEFDVVDPRRVTASVLGAVTSLAYMTTAAIADGGAHVVDSANVETPGVCHLEMWGTSFEGDRGLFNLAPACTFKSLPILEIGAAVQHLPDPEQDDTLIGPAFKLNLRSTETGLGLGLIANSGFSLRSGNLDNAALIVPITIPVSDKVLVNLNGGWVYAAGSDQRHQAFYGGQILAVVIEDVSLMAEVFGTSSEQAGFQGGARWTPNDGPFDIDLLYGQRVDGSDSHAVTVGITVRQ